MGSSAPEGGSTALATPPSDVGRSAEPAAPVVRHQEPRVEPVALTEGLSESLVPFYERSSLVTEQYRSLRTRLLSQNPNYEHRIIAITSAVP